MDRQLQISFKNPFIGLMGDIDASWPENQTFNAALIKIAGIGGKGGGYLITGFFMSIQDIL